MTYQELKANIKKEFFENGWRVAFFGFGLVMGLAYGMIIGFIIAQLFSKLF